MSPTIDPDCDRPIERWFLGINQGDTPETSQIARITEGWILEFLALTGQAPAVASAEPAAPTV